MNLERVAVWCYLRADRIGLFLSQLIIFLASFVLIFAMRLTGHNSYLSKILARIAAELAYFCRSLGNTITPLEYSKYKKPGK